MGKVFITGANGFVGRHFVSYLKQKNIPYKAGLREKTVSATLPDEVVYGDLNRVQDWQPYLIGCDQVVHLAARSHMMHETSGDPLAAYMKMNVEGALHLAASCKKNGIKKFVFLSTIKVNGETTTLDQPFMADDTPHPSDAYALSKYHAEKSLMLMHEPGVFEVVIIRPPLIYGPDVKGNLKTLLKIVDRQIPLPFASVKNHRSLISVLNLCDLILTCLQKPEAGGNIFLASDDFDYSMKDLVQKMAAVLGKKALLFPFPKGAMFWFARLLNKQNYADRLIGHLHVDIEKTKKVLGWTPTYSFEETFNANKSSDQTDQHNHVKHLK